MDPAFDDGRWEELTASCIGCGACTYLCPTCHCFDIADESRLYKGRRIRTWDSCQFPLFTKHASGHNPRKTKKERLRQRFMHKFSYAVENTGDRAVRRLRPLHRRLPRESGHPRRHPKLRQGNHP